MRRVNTILCITCRKRIARSFYEKHISKCKGTGTPNPVVKSKGSSLSVGYYSIPNIAGVVYKVQGTWELEVAKWLNAQGILWVRNLTLKYLAADGVNRSYYPDFYIPSLDIYLEVKGLYDEKAQDKMKRVMSTNKVKLYMLYANHIEMVKGGTPLVDILALKSTKKI